MSCIFCRIIAGEIPSPRVHENAAFIVIRDIQPQARKHLLVVPKDHHASLLEVPTAVSSQLHSGLLSTALEAVGIEGMAAEGFRLVINTRDWGGQSVHHIHMHVLGGEPLGGRFA